MNVFASLSHDGADNIRTCSRAPGRSCTPRRQQRQQPPRSIKGAMRSPLSALRRQERNNHAIIEQPAVAVGVEKRAGTH